MRSLILSLFFGLSLGALLPHAVADETPPQSTQAQSTQVQSAQQIIDQVLGEYDLIGAAVSLYTADGQVDKGIAGLRKIGDETPVGQNDKWHLGSCTKAMTAALVAEQVQAGTLDFDATMPALFPHLADNMHEAWHTITMGDLLTHRSGLVDSGLLFALLRFKTGTVRDTRKDLASALLTVKPAGEHGTYQYSNMGYILAGAALENMTDMAWEDLMRAGLVGQLMGQEGWGFGPPLGGQPEGHLLSASGEAMPVGTGEAADNPLALGPAGTVHATHDAWAKFARGLISDDGLLTTKIRDALFTPPAGEVYSYGWVVTEHEDLGTLYAHNGSNTMWYSLITIRAETGDIVLASTNQFSEKAQQGIAAATRTLLKQRMAEAE